MGEVFDLDAVARDETAEPFRFRFGGEDYELPSQPDLRAAAVLQAGRLDEGFRLLLGEDGWQRILASPAVFDASRLEALIEQYEKHAGITLGESSASTGSSRSTGRPSKRTSSGTTKSRSVR